MKVTVDINKVEKLVNSDKFSKFLLNNTTDFAVAAFILSVLIEKIDEIKALP